MPRDTLNGDEQGEQGQSRFREICVNAGLVCNESTRDRTGWDFLVEFPFAPAETVRSVDERPAPISSHFQIKTLGRKQDRVKMRLSSAERLAREAKPAFIYIFCVDGLEFGESRLIHVFDDVLANILKRLREEQVAGNASIINRKYLTLSTTRYGIPLPPTGHALRSAIAKVCGADFEGYVARKVEQVRKLGFTPSPYKGRLRFIGLRDLDELAETFLGLKGDVEVEMLNFSKTRFGIAVPIPELIGKNFVISVDPSPVDCCTIVVRHETIAFPMIFDANVFVPVIPNFPTKSFKSLLKSALFSILISGNGDVDLRLDENLLHQAQPPERWADLARLMTVFALGGTKIEIRSKNRSDYAEFTIDRIEGKIDPVPWQRWLKLCEYTSHLFHLAGVSGESRICIKDLETNGTNIFEAGALLSGQVSGLSFLSQPMMTEVEGGVRTIFAGCIDVGDLRIAYWASVDFVLESRTDGTRWKSTRIIAGRVRMIPRTVAAFANFVEEAKEEAKITVSVVFRPPDGTPALISSS